MKKTDLVALVSLGAVSLLTALAYPHLPAHVTTHFDFRGEPNGSMSRLTFALFCPVLAALLWSFGRFVSPHLKDRFNLPRGVPEGVQHLLLLLPLGIVLGVHVMLLRYAQAPSARMIHSAVPVLLGVVCLVLSLVLPRVRENPFVGIRVPWLRGRPTLWARTHKVAGYTHFGAFLGCVACLFLPASAASILAVSCMLGGSFIPVVYSLWISRHEAA